MAALPPMVKLSARSGKSVQEQLQEALKEHQEADRSSVTGMMTATVASTRKSCVPAWLHSVTMPQSLPLMPCLTASTAITGSSSFTSLSGH